MAVTFGVIGPSKDEVRAKLEWLCERTGLEPLGAPVELPGRWIGRAVDPEPVVAEET